VGLNFEYESFELEIFDRWGGLIWQTDNLFKGWDGTHMKSGNRVKQGMYVYQFRLRQFDTFEPKVFKGTVTLYRHN
jgi:gliding motility-associated-like protein